MKKLSIILLTALAALPISARSLSVSTGNVNYIFTSTTMGEAVVSDDGSTIKIKGKVFPVGSITAMKVVEEDMENNLVTVAYSEGKAVVNVAGNVARYIDPELTGAHVDILQSDEVGDNTCGEITYSLSGSASDGSFILAGTYKCSIDLRGLNLTNPTGAALEIQNGKRVELSVKSETVNYLADGAGGSQKGAIVCKGHLEFKGKGTLNVAGKTAHAVQAKEYVSIKNCTLNVTESVKDGINCTQYFLLESGEVNLSGIGDDAVQVDYKDAENREAEDTGSITVTGGKFTAVTTAKAAKGLKAEGKIAISGGELDITVNGGGVWDSTKLKTKASSCLSADEDMDITGGTMKLTATGSGGKGISVDGTLKVTDGEINITTSGGVFAYVNGKEQDNYTGNTDNLKSDYKSSAKGIKVDTFVQIDGGTINVKTSGKNAEGIESKGQLTINGGTIYIYAYDDAINSSSHMNINGGDITVIATNNDGLDSNGNLYINGGYIRAFGASAPECGIDANEEGGYKVFFNGGTLLAVGGGNSVPSTSASTQPYVGTSASATANATVQLKNGTTVLAEFTIPAEYKSQGGMFGVASGPGGPGGGGGGMGGGMGSGFLITCPGLTSGSSYTLVNGSSSSTVTAKYY